MMVASPTGKEVSGAVVPFPNHPTASAAQASSATP